MKKLLLALALLLVPAAASAQCNGVFANNTVCGNVTGTTNTPRPTPITSFPSVPGGISGQIQYNNSGALGGLTDTQVTARINVFTSVLSGAVPLSGGGTTNYLRADGTWAALPANVSSLNGLTGALTFSVNKRVISGTSTYTPTTGTKYAIIECVGSGAGGGGVTGSASPVQVGGGGGGSGGYSRVWVTAATIGASQAVTIGNAGAGGAAGNNAGGNGSDVSVGTICIGKGGIGGGFSNSTTIGRGGLGGTDGTGDFTTRGSPGWSGIFAGTSAITVELGNGASSLFGGGAPATDHTAPNNGVNAVGYGSGGSGAFASAATTKAGGDGSKGVVIITEFIII